MKIFYTTQEVAKMWSLSERTVLRMTKSGEFKHKMIDGVVMYDEADLEQYIEDHTYIGKVLAKDFVKEIAK